MDERPRSPLLSLLFFPIALALMVPFLAVMVAWLYVGAALHGLCSILVRLTARKSPPSRALQPPHFSQILAKRITTDEPRR